MLDVIIKVSSFVFIILVGIAAFVVATAFVGAMLVFGKLVLDTTAPSREALLSLLPIVICAASQTPHENLLNARVKCS